MSDDECIPIDLDAMWEEEPYKTDKGFGYHSIRMHPIMRSILKCEDTAITHENKDTFIQTRESVEAAVDAWGPSISYVKEEIITYELCRKAIENNSESICGVKPHLLTEAEYYELCKQVVSDNGCNLKYIPRYVQTQELTDIALNRSCIAIQHCLHKYKTYENCLVVVNKNGQLIEYVPKKFITKEMCMAAAKSRYPCLNHIPVEFISRELCKAAVEANGKNVEWVPDDYMSSELGYIAITSPEPSNPTPDMAGSNIQYIPAKCLTKEIIVESAKRWYPTYHRIPKECLTDEIENAVLDVSPECIKFMEQTPEKCMRAIRVNPYIIWNYIAKENITREMVDYVLSLQHVKHQYSDAFIEYLQSAVV